MSASFCCFAAKIPEVKPSDADLSPHTKLAEELAPDQPAEITEQPVGANELESALEGKPPNGAADSTYDGPTNTVLGAELDSLKDVLNELRSSLAETNTKHATEVADLRKEIVQLKQDVTEVQAAADAAAAERDKEPEAVVDHQIESRARSAAEPDAPSDDTCVDGDRREVEGEAESDKTAPLPEAILLKQHVDDELKLFKEHSDQQIAGRIQTPNIFSLYHMQASF
jgi:hypothetical protein